MKPAAPPELPARAARYQNLTRWERSEVGRDLRRLGWTYGEIRTEIPVPKATLAGWCRDIRLSAAQVAAIKERVAGSRRGVPVDTQWRRRAEIKRIRAEARRRVPGLVTDPLWTAGVVLYWAEGTKAHRALAVTNADRRLLNVFIAWVRTFIDPGARFVLSLHLHAGDDESAAREHWASELHIDHPEFTKSFVKPGGSGHRTNKLAHGVCRVRVRRSTDAWITTMAWIDSISEHLGSDQDWPTATLAPGR